MRCLPTVLSRLNPPLKINIYDQRVVMQIKSPFNLIYIREANCILQNNNFSLQTNLLSDRSVSSLLTQVVLFSISPNQHT